MDELDLADALDQDDDDNGAVPMELDPDTLDKAPAQPPPPSTTAVFTFEVLRPTQVPGPSAARGSPYLKDTARHGIPLVFASAAEKPTWHELDKKLGTPAFCQLAARLLDPQAHVDDTEWLARYLAYIRLPERHELPSVPDRVGNERAAGNPIAERMSELKTTAGVYRAKIEAMVLIIQEDCGATWPNHGRILIWVNAQQPNPVWHVVATLLGPAVWTDAPPFWAANKMEAALAHEPLYLDFWKKAHSRYQSLLGAVSAPGAVQ